MKRISPEIMTTAPSHSDEWKPNRSAIRGDMDMPRALPTRAKPRLSPKARASSLPMNHLASTLLSMTIWVSAPRPKSSRPNIIILSSGE